MEQVNLSENLRSTGKNKSLHGQIYQLKLLMLFLYRGIINKYSFKLSTEKEEAKKFDDLFFEIKKDGEIEYRLLQAKHKDGKFKQKITFKDILTESDGDYSLIKYFFSYQDSKKEKFFKNGKIKDVIMCTNIDIDKNDKYSVNGDLVSLCEVVGKIEEEDPILDINLNSKQGVRYKFSDKIIPLLKPRLENYNLTRLAIRLVDCILKNNPIKHHERSVIFYYYDGALAREVIDVKRKQFHNQFIQNVNLSEEATHFRKSLLHQLNAKSNNQLTLENINSAILEKRCINNQKIGLNLSKKFGTKDNQNWPDPILEEDIQEFLRCLIFVVNSPDQWELGKIIENDISEEFNFIETENIYNEFFVKMLDWFNGKGNEFISYENGKELFEDIKQKLNDIKLLGLVEDYIYELKKFNIDFDSGALPVLKLENFLNADSTHQKLLNIFTCETTLSSIKLYNFLQDKWKNYIFIRLETILRFEGQLLQAFQKKCNLLVIANSIVEKDVVVQKFHDNILKIISAQENNDCKKIILISNCDDTLARKFENSLQSRYLEIQDNKNSFLDLTTASQEKLLREQQIVFQGEKMNLRALVSDDNVKALLDSKVLYKLIMQEEIEIGEKVLDLGDIRDYYINRTFIPQTKINSNVTENNCNKFVIIDRESDFILQNIEPDKDLVLISDKEDNFIEICNKFPKNNIHRLKWQQKSLIWKQSRGSLEHLRGFVDKECDETYFREAKDINDKIVIITGDPGMGKSTVLTKIAQELKSSNPCLWILKLNFSDHFKNFEDLKNKCLNIDLTHVITILFKSACSSALFKNISEERLLYYEKNIAKIFEVKEDLKLELDLTGNYLKGESLLEFGLFVHYFNEKKIIILLDGYDETIPDFRNEIIQFVKVLKMANLRKLWITSREYNVLNELENILGTFSYILKPFSRKNQLDFLKLFWGNSLGFKENNDKIFQNFIKGTVAQLNKMFTDILLCSPLILRMTAEIFEETFARFYENEIGNSAVEKIVDVIGKFNLSNLYETFIQKKFQKPFKEISAVASPSTRRIMEQAYKIFLEMHKLLAVYEIFGKVWIKKFISEEALSEIYKFLEDIKRGEEKTGIIVGVFNNSPTFIHHTFAEYFAANYFWEKFKNVDLKYFNNDFVDPILIELVSDSHIQICEFLQSTAVNDLKKNSNQIINDIYLHKIEILLKILIEKYSTYSRNLIVKVMNIVEFSFSLQEHKTWINEKNMVKCINAWQLQFLLKDVFLAGDKYIYFNLLRSSLELNVMSDFAPYNGGFFCPRMHFINCIENNAPIDLFKLLLEKSNIVLINDFLMSKGISLPNLCNHTFDCGIEVIKFLSQKGINIMQSIFFDRICPCHYQDKNELCYLLYDIELFLKYMNLLQDLLTKGIGLDFLGNRKVLNNVKKQCIAISFTNEICLFRERMHLKTTNPFDIILKIFFDNINRSSLYKIIICREGLFLSSDGEVEFFVFLAESSIAKLFAESYFRNNIALIRNTLNVLQEYVTKNKKRIKNFKGGEKNEFYMELLQTNRNYFKLRLKFYIQKQATSLSERKISKIEDASDLYNSLLGFALRLYVDENYEFNNALKKVSDKVLKLEETLKKVLVMQSKNDNSTLIFTTDEILYILDLQNIVIDVELNNFRSKISDQWNRSLQDIWGYLNYFEEKARTFVSKPINYSNLSYEFLELLDPFFRSYDELVNAITNNSTQNLENILKNFNPSFKRSLINSQDNERGTLLHLATFKNDIETVRILLLHGANPNIELQAKNKLYLEHKNWPTELKKVDYSGCLPLHFAISNGNKEIITILLNNKGDVNVENYLRKTPRHFDALLKNFGHQINIWKERPFSCCKFHEAPLHYIALCGNLDLVKFLIEMLNANTNEKYYLTDMTPLHYAVAGGNLVIVKYLIKKQNIHLQAVNFHLFNPLHIAAHCGRLNIVKYLIENKLMPADISDSDGMTPLHYAAYGHRFFIVKYLIENHNVNAKSLDIRGKTALYYAFEFPRDLPLDWLRDIYSAEDGYTNDFFITPLHYAARAGDLDSVRDLIELHGFSSIEDSYNMTPLHYAAEAGHLDVVEFLINCGHPYVKDRFGLYASYYAAEAGYFHIVKYFDEINRYSSCFNIKDMSDVLDGTALFKYLREKIADVKKKKKKNVIRIIKKFLNFS